MDHNCIDTSAIFLPQSVNVQYEDGLRGYLIPQSEINTLRLIRISDYSMFEQQPLHLLNFIWS